MAHLLFAQDLHVSLKIHDLLSVLLNLDLEFLIEALEVIYMHQLFLLDLDSILVLS